MDFFGHLFLILALLTGVLAVDYKSEDKSYWMNDGKEKLQEILKRQNMNMHAKNVIIFIGDGMGISTVTSARIYKGQKKGTGEGETLSFEKFANIGLSKTYAVDKQVTDSAASGTALFSGVKTKYHMLGLDVRAQYNACDATVNEKSETETIMSWAQDAGKDTGIVTKTRVTHATPAATYAHINNRDWECENAIPEIYKNCVKDIAMQLVTTKPGNKFKIIMGGGANQLGLNGTVGQNEVWCIRKDGRNLAAEWQNKTSNRILVTTKKQLMDIDIKKTDYLMGLFSPDHMYYAGEKYLKQEDQPSLVNMTTQAIKILKKNPKGFVLMVEGGLIDIAHHSNYAKLSLEETLEFEEAIAAAAQLTDEKDTLIVVTADHSHTLTINGYPNRGNDILGTTVDGNITYETLSYANGPSFSYHVQNQNNSSHLWRDLKDPAIDRNGTYYPHFSPIQLQWETHGGEDVPVYANGPSSYVFSGVYQESYIAHGLSFAACIGPHAKECSGVYAENSTGNIDFVPCSGPDDKSCNRNASKSESSGAVWGPRIFIVTLLLHVTVYWFS